HDMLTELREDNSQLAACMREAHTLCDEHGDVATARLLEVWIDEAERRVWFLFESHPAGLKPQSPFWPARGANPLKAGPCGRKMPVTPALSPLGGGGSAGA